MGTLGGHVLPGSIFISLSIWWTFQTFDRYFRARTKTGPPYRSTTWFSCRCAPHLPLEPIIKVVGVIIGMTGECVTGFDSSGVFVNIGNVQHMTMFFFFGLGGVIEILVFYKFPVPDGSEYVVNILAYIVEGLLFFFHLHGRTMLDVRVHLLLVCSILGCVIASALEMRHRNNVLGTLGRAFFTLLQGTWICHVGFILYPPYPWMPHYEEMADEHKYLMLLTAMYTWHCAGILVLFLIIGYVVYLKYRMTGLLLDRFQSYSDSIPITKNGHIPLSIDSDSDAGV